MGLFGNKNKKDTEGKKNFLTAYDRMEYIIVEDRSNETVFKIANNVLDGKPVLANFDKLDTPSCNYILSFMSGVVYATEGEAVQVSKKLFLFARKEELEDGSLKQYVEDNKA